MQSLLSLLRAGIARYAFRRRDHIAKPVGVAGQGTSAEPGVTILSYDSFR